MTITTVLHSRAVLSLLIYLPKNRPTIKQFCKKVGVNGLGCGLRIKKIAPIIKEKTPKHGMTRHI